MTTSSSVSRDLAAIGLEFAPAGLSLFSRTNNSELYLLKAAGFPHELIIKYPRAASRLEAEELVREEYAALLQVYTSGAETPMCPKPYELLLSSGALAMEYVAADSLRTKLLDRSTDVAAKLELMRQTGARLRAFHDRFAGEARRVKAHELLQEAVAAIGNAASSDVPARYLQLLQDNCQLIDDALLPVSAQHGDCKPDNFLCSDRDILMVDLHMRHSSYCVAELAYFLNSFLLLALEPSGLHLLRGRAKAESAFLEGYGVSPDPAERGRVAWFRLRSLLLMSDGSMSRRLLKRVYVGAVHRLIFATLRRDLRNSMPAIRNSRPS